MSNNAKVQRQRKRTVEKKRQTSQINSPPELVPDILYEIFFYLFIEDEDDPALISENGTNRSNPVSDIYSCLLVKKSWSEVALQFLYSRPFMRRGRKQVELYLSMLKYNEIKYLKSQGIQEMNKIHSNYQITTKYPYPAYLKTLDYGRLVMSVWAFCNSNWTTRALDNKVILVTRALLRLFARSHSTHFTIINCSLGKYSFADAYYSILAEPEFDQFLATVKRCKIDCNFADDATFLDQIPRSLRNLDKIDMKSSTTMNKLGKKCFITDYSSVIISQKNLVSLQLQQYESFLDRILESLTFQSHSLVELKFVECDFNNCLPWWGIAACQKLTDLQFIRCWNISFDIATPVLSATFPYLQNVSVVECAFNCYHFICPEFRQWASNYSNSNVNHNNELCNIAMNKHNAGDVQQQQIEEVLSNYPALDFDLRFNFDVDAVGASLVDNIFDRYIDLDSVLASPSGAGQNGIISDNIFDQYLDLDSVLASPSDTGQNGTNGNDGN
ncbi:1186_t:CDS:2 [Ambispora gerdemannii]|uniref:1186_t:CDS:1 n=1 Tax=Ambispora gerdemannii TaxID=144530 RepID=A0A9N8V190_9GLOM|nr:1186_t:CDS:2 [Ambispora gerdemannii]